jgi:hypothetical protein
MRYTFLYGIDPTGTNMQEATDDQLSAYVETAEAEIERALGMVIRKRIYRTNYTGAEQRRPKYRTTADKWTHIEQSHPYIDRNWRNQGYIVLNNRPLISVERALLKTVTGQTLIDLGTNNWLRLDANSGQVWLFPKQSGSYPIYGPYLGIWSQILNGRGPDYVDAFEFDYTAGYETSDFIPDDVRNAIGQLAAMWILLWVGDGLQVGLSSSSLSLDGLSESLTTTQSGSTPLFGARIKEYRQSVSEFIKRNRNNFSGQMFVVA